MSTRASLLALAVSLVACKSGSGSNDDLAATPGDGAIVTTTDGATAGDAGPNEDGGTTTTGAIMAPDDQWTWVDFPDSKCANGTPTGLAINPHAGATSLMIYFEGGGACTDYASCWASNPPAASNLTGYGAAEFAAKPPAVPTEKRDSVGNPFAAMNLVFVPYCTGDMHSGTTMQTLTSGSMSMPTYFWGGKDMDLFLARLVPTFPNQKRLWVTGTSAGGFATYLNFGRIHDAFGVAVDLVDDSGPPIVVNHSMTNNNIGLFTVWGTVAGLPASCSTCKSLRNVLDDALTTQLTFTPPGQFAFLSFDEDKTIAPDFGYDPVTDYPGLMATFSSSLPAAPTAATFLVSGLESHVVQSDVALEPTYMAWLTQMVNRDPTWSDATPVGK